MDISAESLIRRCRVKSRLNDSGGVFSDEEILMHLNDQLQNRIVPFYMTFKADYFLTHQEFDYTSPMRIPSNAINQKIARVELLSQSPASKVKYLRSPHMHESGFYLEGDKIIFQNVQEYPIRLWFYKRPSSLTFSYTAINQIDSYRRQFTLQNIPTTWKTGTYEVNRTAVNDYGYIDKIDVEALSGNSITLRSIPPNVKVDDFVSLLSTSPIATIPYEASYLLILYTCLAFNLDTSLIISLEKEIPSVEKRLRQISSPRIDDTYNIFSRKTLFNNSSWI